MRIPFGGCRTARCPQIAPLKWSPVFIRLGVVRFNVGLVQGHVELIPCVLATAAIEEQHVMKASEMLAALLGIIVRGLPLPHNFVDEVLLT